MKTFATLIFGDLGADIIKIESGQPGKSGDLMRYAGASPTGDLGPIFTNLNRNKKSVPQVRMRVRLWKIELSQDPYLQSQHLLLAPHFLRMGF